MSGPFQDTRPDSDKRQSLTNKNTNVPRKGQGMQEEAAS